MKKFRDRITYYDDDNEVISVHDVTYYADEPQVGRVVTFAMQIEQCYSNVDHFEIEFG